MADLKRTIIILMLAACIVNIIGLVHCNVYYSYASSWFSFRTGYSVLFPVLLAITAFILIEQLVIADGTVTPLNRLRIIYAFGAAVILIIFGVSAAIVGSRWFTDSYHHGYYRDALIAAMIAFIDAAIYIGEAVSRNRKSGIV